MNRRWQCLLLAAAVGAGQPTMAASSLVYGSFSTVEGARRACGQLQAKVDRPLAIQQSQVKGNQVYRLVEPLDGDQAAQRQRLTEVRARVQPSVWLNLDDQAGEASITCAESPLVAAAEPPATSPLPAESAPATAESAPTAPESAPTAAESQPPESVQPVSATGRSTPAAATTTVASGAVETPVTALTGRDPIVVARFQDDEAAIRIDGKLDEAVWAQVRPVDDMRVIEPDSLAKTVYSTEIRFLHTDKGLYVGVHNHEPQDTLLARLTKRDMYINRDGNTVMLDTSGSALYGLWFDINLGGSLADGKFLPEKTFSNDWDGPWKGAAAETGDGYATEYFLPWSMMAMPVVEGRRKMGVLLMRRVARRDETWGWPPLTFTSSKFMSALVPLELQDVNPRQQFAFYPFASATHDRIDSATEYRTGVDWFWRPSLNLQLMATLNPDFGTVETDDVVVNLSAFETFFREKRLFFLEENEIFSTTPRANPFGTNSTYNTGARKTSSYYSLNPTMLVNTRRIGGPPLAPAVPRGTVVPDTERFQPTQLLGAFKVAGQRSGVRYGALAAFEDDTRIHGSDAAGAPVRFDQDGREFGIVRVLKEDTSNGMRSLGWITTLVRHPDRDAMVHGIDGHYISPSTRLRADLQLMASDVEDVEGYGGLIDLSYKPRQGVTHVLNLDYLDEHIELNDFGFARRNDVTAMSYSFEHLDSNVEGIRSWMKSILFAQEYNQDGRLVDAGIFWRNNVTLKNSWLWRTELDFFPERWDDRNSKGNGDFRIADRATAEVGFGTPTSKPFAVSLALGTLQEDLGGWTRFAKGGFTWKPIDNLSVELDLEYQRRDGWLVRTFGRQLATFESTNWYPKLAVEYFLSARQQLRMTMQWAGIRAGEQARWAVPIGDGELIEVTPGPLDPDVDFGISQLSAQLRYRWEIAPLSDLFVVYTRGSRIQSAGEEGFEDAFRESILEPMVDLLVVKLRYRFGT